MKHFVCYIIFMMTAISMFSSNENILSLCNINNVNINEVIKKIEENIKASNEIDNKIIFANIRGVLTEVNEIKNLIKILSNNDV